MDFYDVINKRRTVREFENDDIPMEVIERIVDAAMKAPSNDHLRDWEYIVIKDKNIMSKVLDVDTIPREFSDEEMKKLAKAWNLNDIDQFNAYKLAVPKQYRMLYEANALIIPIFKEKVDILHPADISHLNVFASIWCSIENFLLASTYENLGCSLRIAMAKEMDNAKKVLNIPEGYFIPCFLGLGKPKKNELLCKQKEINTKEKIHFNKF